MSEGQTTIAVQGYLAQLARVESGSPPDPIIRALLDRSVSRLHHLCGALLARSYPRLARPPLNLQAEEMLSAVVDRLIRALQEVRPTTVRQFFALANQHMRWELNDLARHLDERVMVMELQEALVPAPRNSASQLSPDALRMLQAIESLPEEEREVFSLVRIQGMTHGEVADMLQTSTKTIQRRLNKALIILASTLSDLNPNPPSRDET